MISPLLFDHIPPTYPVRLNFENITAEIFLGPLLHQRQETLTRNLQAWCLKYTDSY